MSKTLFPVVAGGVIVAGVAALVYKAYQASKVPGTSVACGVARAAAGAYIGPAAQSLPCGPVDKLIDGIFTTDAQKDARNIALNGAIAIPLDEGGKMLVRCRGIQYTGGTATTTGGSGGTGGGSVPTLLPKVPLLKGTVARFLNGCEPFEGAPGWVRCAPGSYPMESRNVSLHSPALPGSGCAYQQREFGTDDEQRPTLAKLLTGKRGDPLTHNRTTPPYARGVALACNDLQDVQVGNDAPPRCVTRHTQTTGGAASSDGTVVGGGGAYMNGLPIGTLDATGSKRWNGSFWERL